MRPDVHMHNCTVKPLTGTPDSPHLVRTPYSTHGNQLMARPPRPHCSAASRDAPHAVAATEPLHPTAACVAAAISNTTP